MTLWGTWAAGVLAGIGAPYSAENVRSLWNWSNKESGANVLRWNNPLNTTLFLPNSQPMNSVNVRKYATLHDGIVATVETLLQRPPYAYPTLLANLRGSVPLRQWGNATHDLGQWGTGTNWLGMLLDPARQDLPQEQEKRKMTEDQAVAVGHLAHIISYGTPMDAKSQVSFVAAWKRGEAMGDIVAGWYTDGASRGLAFPKSIAAPSLSGLTGTVKFD